MSSHPQVCIITGASRGIGAATAKLAASTGHAVIVNYLRNETGAKNVVRDIEAEGGLAIAVQADVADADQVAQLFRNTIDHFGVPNILINNAADPGSRSRVEDLTADAIQQVLSVTLNGPILCIAEAARCMSLVCGGIGGTIINVSSQAAITGGYHLTPYVAAKAGIEAITIGLARELGPLGIRVNGVRPGLISTQSSDSGEESRAGRALEVPLGRLGTAQDVAETIMWLTSPASSYVTGAIVSITGGR